MNQPVHWAEVQARPEWFWADVSQLTPFLAVRRDRSTVDIPIVDDLAGGLELGDRVMVQVNGTVPTVIGRKDGSGLPGAGWHFEHPASVTSGWKTIAYWPGNGRNMSRFTVLNGSSGDHEQLIFEFSLAYSRATIVPISYNAFGRTSPALTGIRYLNDNVDETYGPGILQVRLASNDDNNWSVHCEQKVDDYLKPMEPVQFSDAVAGYNTTTPRTQVGVTFSDWRGLSLTNGWTRESIQYPPGRFRMSPGGVILLDGLLKGTSATALDVATLPEGARPEYRTILASIASIGGNVMARTDILPTGAIRFNTSGTAGYYSLSGLTFQAYQ